MVAAVTGGGGRGKQRVGRGRKEPGVQKRVGKGTLDRI